MSLDLLPVGTEVYRTAVDGSVISENVKWWVERHQDGPHDVIIRRSEPNSLSQAEIPWASRQLVPVRTSIPAQP
jgi:hypothetical protein